MYGCKAFILKMFTFSLLHKRTFQHQTDHGYIYMIMPWRRMLFFYPTGGYYVHKANTAEKQLF